MNPPPPEAPGRREGQALTIRHQKVQRLRRLLSRRSARQAERAFVVEGAKVLSEALDAGVAIEAVYVASGCLDEAVARRAFDAGHRVYELAAGVLERVAGTVTPQPVMAVVPFLDVALASLRAADLLVVAIDVRDPGNAGTVLRSAEASGAGGVVLCDGSVDLYNPKTVRASAGALFHLPVVNGGPASEVLSELAQWGLRRLATRATGGDDYANADMTGRLALVVGNEASGLSDDVSPSVDGWLTIPMTGRSESLNVGMATAVLCFEAARQRRAVAAEGVTP